MENEIEVKTEWWKDEQFLDELDRCHEALQSGADKGVTLEEITESINKYKTGEIALAQKLTIKFLQR